jgi:hypothetical protein
MTLQKDQHLLANVVVHFHISIFSNLQTHYICSSSSNIANAPVGQFLATMAAVLANPF